VLRDLQARSAAPEAAEATRRQEREMMNPFAYHAPTDDEVSTMLTTAELLTRVYTFLTDALPPSAERTLAIRKLQEARMWANAAVVGITINA
jgi:hypothetical protein